MDFIKIIREKFDKKDSAQEQMLILELSEAAIRMDIYQHGELSSRMIQLQVNINDDGIDKYFNELVRVLRSELLWRVEEAAEVVFLLPENWCYVDKIELPAVDKRELQRTLEWELEQYVPWPRNNYYYDTHCLGDSKNTYMIAAASQLIVDRLMQVGEELAVQVKEITTAVSTDGYLAGKVHPNLLPPRYKRNIQYRSDIKLAEIILAVAIVGSIGLVMVAQGWRYWNMENVNSMQNRLHALSEWEERMDWSEAAQHRLNHMERIIGLVHKDKKPLLPQLELWGRTVGDSCWLERIEAKDNNSEFILHGKGVSPDVVTSFMDKLKNSGLYNNVELIEMKRENKNTYVGFVVRLMLKNGEK